MSILKRLVSDGAYACARVRAKELVRTRAPECAPTDRRARARETAATGARRAGGVAPRRSLVRVRPGKCAKTVKSGLIRKYVAQEEAASMCACAVPMSSSPTIHG